MLVKRRRETLEYHISLKERVSMDVDNYLQSPYIVSQMKYKITKESCPLYVDFIKSLHFPFWEF